MAISWIINQPSISILLYTLHSYYTTWYNKDVIDFYLVGRVMALDYYNRARKPLKDKI